MCSMTGRLSDGHHGLGRQPGERVEPRAEAGGHDGRRARPRSTASRPALPASAGGGERRPERRPQHAALGDDGGDEAAGVTSKAGLRTRTPVGRDLRRRERA